MHKLKDYLFYQDDWATIYCGDCRDILPMLEPVDLVLTDPPYSSGTRQATDRVASNIPKRGERWNPERSGIIWDTSFSTFGFSIFMNWFYRQIKNKLESGGHVYSFIDWRQYPLLTLSIESGGLMINNVIVWDKGVYALGGNYRSQHEFIVFASNGPARRLNEHDLGNVIQCKRISGADHPTEKPVDLIEIILTYASEEKNTILDPFMGSGTTLVAAKNLNRKSIGIEIEPKYCEIAVKRLRQEVFDFRRTDAQI